MDMGKFDLMELRSYFTEIGQILQNMTLRMESLENELEGVRTGKEEFLLKHLRAIKDEDEKYWRFLKWWKIPEIEDKDFFSLKGVFIGLQPKDKDVIEKLFGIIKNIEIVSCILRFVAPKHYGIFSAPVENLLHIKGKTPIDKYINYLNDLEKLREYYKFKRIADVDMALWTLANILNYPELRTYPKYQMVYEKYRRQTNPIKMVMAMNSLDQIWEEKGYLFIAELFIDTDHEVAGIIAGREIERVVKNMCDKYKVKRERKTPPSVLSRELWERGHITSIEHTNINKWWDLRITLTHKFGVLVSRNEVEKMIKGLINLKEKYKIKIFKENHQYGKKKFYYKTL